MYDKYIAAIKERRSLRAELNGNHKLELLATIEAEKFDKGAAVESPVFGKKSISGTTICRNGMCIEIVTGSFLGTFTQVSITPLKKLGRRS